MIEMKNESYLKIITYKGIKVIDNFSKSKNVLLMFPEISGESPYMFGDFACEDNNQKRDKCYGIFSYKKKTGNNYSPLTNLISNNGKYRIIQFNYPDNINNIVNIVNEYLLSNNITPKNYTINVYGQSMGGKIAIIITNNLNRKGYKINNLYINSSPILSNDVIFKVYPEIQSLLYYIAGYVKPDFLYGIISPNPKKEKNIDISINEIKKIIKTQQISFKNKQSMFNKLKFIANNQLVIKAIEGLKINGKIYLIVSYPPKRYRFYKHNDGLIKHSFTKSFIKYLKKENQNKVNIIKVNNAFHSSVSGHNLKYFNSLKQFIK